jgi:16S rRNA (uracil1498-N3)-methyltransferase
VEHGRRSAVARVVVPAAFAAGDLVSLDAGAAHHLRVLRLDVGARIGLTDGAGLLGRATVRRLGRSDADVTVESVQSIPRPPAVHMAVPVADRDRMLWLAEKCTELAATSWRPIVWRRSASVSPSGTGAAFRAKIGARMVAALAQSGGAWLPDLCMEAPLDEVIAGLPEGMRLLLDPAGEPLIRIIEHTETGPVTVVTGPEGGLEDAERDRLMASGFVRTSLAATILRFETAAVAGLAVLRAMTHMGAAAERGGGVTDNERGGDGGD